MWRIMQLLMLMNITNLKYLADKRKKNSIWKEKSHVDHFRQSTALFISNYNTLFLLYTYELYDVPKDYYGLSSRIHETTGVHQSSPLVGQKTQTEVWQGVSMSEHISHPEVHWAILHCHKIHSKKKYLGGEGQHTKRSRWIHVLQKVHSL